MPRALSEADRERLTAEARRLLTLTHSWQMPDIARRLGVCPRVARSILRALEMEGLVRYVATRPTRWEATR